MTTYQAIVFYQNEQVHSFTFNLDGDAHAAADYLESLNRPRNERDLEYYERAERQINDDGTGALISDDGHICHFEASDE